MTISQSDIIFHTLKCEGGWSTHGKDPGGATNHGVSLRWLQSQSLDVGDIDGDGDIDEDDIRGLSLENAFGLYREKFWDVHFYRIMETHPKTAAKVFDLGVNTGPRQAGKFFQRALNGCVSSAKLPQIVDDGIIGAGTMVMFRGVKDDVSDDELVGMVCWNAMKFYEQIIKLNPDLAVFKSGWINRLNKRIEVNDES